MIDSEKNLFLKQNFLQLLFVSSFPGGGNLCRSATTTPSGSPRTSQQNVYNPAEGSTWNPFDDDNFSKLTAEELLNKDFAKLGEGKWMVLFVILDCDFSMLKSHQESEWILTVKTWTWRCGPFLKGSVSELACESVFTFTKTLKSFDVQKILTYHGLQQGEQEHEGRTFQKRFCGIE